MVSQTLLRASVASRTQSWGRVHYLRLGKGLCLLSWVGIACRPSADVARRECFNALRKSTKTCGRENLWLAPVPAICALVRSVLTTHGMGDIDPCALPRYFNAQ